jgi:hypothetical protein
MAQRRTRNRINAKLEKALVAYIAAGAAAALVATSTPAEARIIYSNTDIRIGYRPIEIDLDHDGVPDFVITPCLAYYHSTRLIVGPQVLGNALQVVPDAVGAAAGFRGMTNGPGNSFRVNSGFCNSTNRVMPDGIGMATSLNYFSFHSVRGPWVNTTNRYLGLKFVISGQTHYGWARVSVNSGLTGKLTGYAYETVPNTQIIEGATSDFAALDAPDPLDQPVAPSFPSLGMLARGFDAFPLWRRDHNPATRKHDDPIG